MFTMTSPLNPFQPPRREYITSKEGSRVSEGRRPAATCISEAPEIALTIFIAMS